MLLGFTLFYRVLLVFYLVSLGLNGFYLVLLVIFFNNGQHRPRADFSVIYDVSGLNESVLFFWLSSRKRRSLSSFIIIIMMIIIVVVCPFWLAGLGNVSFWRPAPTTSGGPALGQHGRPRRCHGNALVVCSTPLPAPRFRYLLSVTDVGRHGNP